MQAGLGPSGRTVYYYDALNEDNMKPYDETGTLSMINHPLMQMVNSKQKQLLKHPLVLALLRRKWKMLGRYIFYLQLMLYVLFLFSITVFAKELLGDHIRCTRSDCQLYNTDVRNKSASGEGVQKN